MELVELEFLGRSWPLAVNSKVLLQNLRLVNPNALGSVGVSGFLLLNRNLVTVLQ